MWSKLLNISWTNNKIAEKASDVEIIKLSKPIGRQDQYLSSLGGISSLRFNKSGSVINQGISSEKNFREKIEKYPERKGNMKKTQKWC